MGDSSFIRGIFVAQEGSSPEQMHAYQEQAEKIHAGQSRRGHDLHDERQLGNFLPSNQGFLLAFLKDPVAAPADRRSRGAVDGRQSTRRVPGIMAFLQPNPVLEISTGATANTQGQFAYALSGIDPQEVYAVAGQADAENAPVSRASCS